MRRRMAVVLSCLLAALAVPAAASPATVEEVASNLICPCGCDNMLVSSCVCGTATQIRSEIDSKLAAGMTAEQIWDEFVRRYGREALATPPADGFHLTVWILPFLAALTAGWMLARILRRWAAAPAPGESSPEPGTGIEDGELLRRMQEELRQFQR